MCVVGGGATHSGNGRRGKKWWWVSASECRCSDEFWVHRAVGRWEAGSPQRGSPPEPSPRQSVILTPPHQPDRYTAPATPPTGPPKPSRVSHCRAATTVSLGRPTDPPPPPPAGV